MQKQKKTRKEKIAEKRNQQSEKKGFDKKRIILTTFFFVGIILTIFEISIYRATIIHWGIPTGIWLTVGVICHRFNAKVLANHMDAKTIFLQLVYNVTTFGGIAVFCFMSLNFKSNNKNIRTYTFEIKRKSSMKGGSNSAKRQPIVEIDYSGLEKDIIFSHSDTENVNKADSIILNVKDGRLGFDVILNKQLISK